MFTVTIQEKYADTLRAFGDLQEAVNLALQRYTIDQVTAKIAELRKQDAAFQEKYALDYTEFARRVATEESFVQGLEERELKTWEIDLAEWEFCHKGAQDWTERLQSLLLE